MTMVPPKSDPRWRTIVSGHESPNFAALPTKMLMMRIRLLTMDRTPQRIEEAVEIAYDFFQKNAAAVKSDIERLCGTNRKDEDL
jgi:hypothetical protein